MMTHFATLSLVAALTAAPATTAWTAGDAKRGGELYEQRCGGCHSVDANRIGPLHCDVLGRKAGGAAGFDYSPALAKSTVRWNDSTLNLWLADPEKLIPGQRMNYSVGNATDREHLIAYLQSVSK